MTAHSDDAESVDALIATLGYHADAVQSLINRVKRIAWLGHVGEPVPYGDEIVRVRSYEEAMEAWRRFVPTSDIVWVFLDELGKALGRHDAMRAAERLGIVSSEAYIDVDHAYELHLNLHIGGIVAGAFREIILRDFTEVRFYHEAIDWFERGHWRCAIAPDGRRIVY